MTITPVAAAPAAPTTGGAGGGSTGDGFRALVQRHLADDPAAGSNAGSGDLSLEATSAILEAASGPSAVPSEGLALLLAGLLASPAAAAVAAAAPAPGTTDGAAPGDTVPLLGTASAGLLADPTTEPAPGAHGLGLGLPEDASDAAAAVMPALSPGPGGNLGSGDGGTTTGAADAAGRPDDTDADATVPPSGAGPGQDDATVQAASAGQSGASLPLTAETSSPSATAAGEPGSSTTVTATASTTATTAVSATTAADAASPAQATPAVPVADQVFGQVSRLVARGDGTHRLMLRLHPADLGEVKVVLTAKDGAVDITVSAGPEACEALREGSPRLRSLLELAGATSGAVSIRDLGSGALVASTGTGQQPHSGQPHQATGSEAGQQGAAGRDGHLPQESPDGRGGDRTGARGSSAVGPREPASLQPGSGPPGGPGSRSRLDIDI